MLKAWGGGRRDCKEVRDCLTTKILSGTFIPACQFAVMIMLLFVLNQVHGGRKAGLHPVLFFKLLTFMLFPFSD